MKKLVSTLVLLFSVGLYAGLVEDGLNAYIKGNYQKAHKLYKQACDGGYKIGCSVYRILNQRGY